MVLRVKGKLEAHFREAHWDVSPCPRGTCSREKGESHTHTYEVK